MEVPIAFASRTLSPAERNYATNEHEALSAFWACEHWKKFLLGRPFTLKTDHASLMSSLTQHTSKRKLAKFIRWLDKLSQFEYDIKYVKGEENVLADFLSRLPLDKQPATNDENELSINVPDVIIIIIIIIIKPFILIKKKRQIKRHNGRLNYPRADV